LSAKKRHRQSEKRRVVNKSRRSRVKSSVRKFDELVSKKDTKAAAEHLVELTKLVDQTAAKGTMHRNAAARKKSRLQKKLNAIKTR
jgi:small subunit ribosomal protein S20